MFRLRMVGETASLSRFAPGSSHVSVVVRVRLNVKSTEDLIHRPSPGFRATLISRIFFSAQSSAPRL